MFLFFLLWFWTSSFGYNNLIVYLFPSLLTTHRNDKNGYCMYNVYFHVIFVILMVNHSLTHSLTHLDNSLGILLYPTHNTSILVMHLIVIYPSSPLVRVPSSHHFLPSFCNTCESQILIRRFSMACREPRQHLVMMELRGWVRGIDDEGGDRVS